MLPYFFFFICCFLLFFRVSLKVWFLFFFSLSYPYSTFLNSDFSTVSFSEFLTPSFSLPLLALWFKNCAILSALFFFFYWSFPFLLYKLAFLFKIQTKISETEKIALETGDVGIEKDFLTGTLTQKKLLSQKFPSLSQEEKSFLKQEVEQLCDMSSEWNFLKTKHLSQQEEAFLKKSKFFALVLPKQYEGLEFSPLAHAKVLEKLASHNIPLSILTMIPNSLGPAKLLLKYGSPSQKKQYLKSLALGEKEPCFALTEAQAGSDASSLQSQAVLFKEKGQLHLKINFEKRWITLSARADLIALAVHLKDPDHLLSQQTNLGITVLLIPSESKGLQRGSYHNPMDLPLFNAPLKGVDIILPAEETILGGLKQAGKGWKMLMECLSMGRAISLPSLSIASAKKCSLLAGQHSFIRRQFGLPLCKFEGIEHALSQVFGWTHLMTSTHFLTLSFLNQGVVSPVLSALTKYQLTEISQKVLKESMDIMGGMGLSLGPRNKIATLYKAIPLAITVEGANILTRTFITYGQGLIKLHPQAYPLVQSLETKDFSLFQKNILKLLYQLLSQCIRTVFHFIFHILLAVFAFFYFKTKALLYFITKSHFFKHSPYCAVQKFLILQKLKYSSTLFSFLSHLSILALGAKLKKKGQTSGRFADWLSLQYMISSLIWYAHHKKTSPVLTQWGLNYCFLENQKLALALLRNYPQTFCRFILKPFVSMLNLAPLAYDISDSLGKKLVQEFFKDENFRKDLYEGVYQPKDPEDQFHQLNKAFELSLKEKDLLKKKKDPSQKESNSPQEQELINQASLARHKALQVDSFSKEEYFS